MTAAAGDNAFTIDQTITSGNFNTLLADRGNGSNVLDSDCVSLEATGRHSGGTVTVRFNAPAAGTYFIAIGFDAKSLIGTAAPSPGTTVHFVFTTNGVPHSTSELDLVEH